MLHPCTYGLSEDYAENQVKTQQFLKKITDRYNKTLSNACNQKNFTKFMKDISKGLWLDAEGAIKYGVIDKII
jgi:ATP-dependent protease ClpP protease subunit